MMDRLLGVRKNVGDQLCLVGMSNGEIWLLMPIAIPCGHDGGMSR